MPAPFPFLFHSFLRSGIFYLSPLLYHRRLLFSPYRTIRCTYFYNIIRKERYPAPKVYFQLPNLRKLTAHRANHPMLIKHKHGKTFAGITEEIGRRTGSETGKEGREQIRKEAKGKKRNSTDGRKKRVRRYFTEFLSPVQWVNRWKFPGSLRAWLIHEAPRAKIDCEGFCMNEDTSQRLRSS